MGTQILPTSNIFTLTYGEISWTHTRTQRVKFIHFLEKWSFSSELIMEVLKCFASEYFYYSFVSKIVGVAFQK